MLSVLDFILIPLAYRVAGGDLNIPGKKALRRYAIPAYLYFLHDLPFLSAVIMGLIFTFNLTEIERMNEGGDGLEEIFLWGLGLAWCLFPLAGLSSLMLPCVWLYLVLASNRRVWPWIKTSNGLDWKYVEIAFGITLASLVQL